MNRAEWVRWLRSETATLEAIRNRMARAAENPGDQEDPRGSRRIREALYRTTDLVDRAREAALGALDEIDPQWDDEETPERPPGTPEACTGAEWLRDGTCDDGGPGGNCPVHSTRSGDDGTTPDRIIQDEAARSGDAFARDFGYGGEETEWEAAFTETTTVLITGPRCPETHEGKRCVLPNSHLGHIHLWESDSITPEHSQTLKDLYDEAYRGTTGRKVRDQPQA